MGRRVLVLGGTSYVAQFLCETFLSDAADDLTAFACTVHPADPGELPAGLELATASPPPPDGRRVVRVFAGVSLPDMASVAKAIEAFQPTVVVNCVAVSSPAACERAPAMAKALNQPEELVAYLQSRAGPPLRYIHFSTDFVYDGRIPPPLGYREQDAVASPGQCVYSATKLAFDDFLLLAGRPNLHVVVLRIANVVGGPPPLFTRHPPKFAQWLANELFRSPEKTSAAVRLWSDEVRSFLSVHDLVRVLWGVVRAEFPHEPAAQLFNVGGCEPLSRVDFARRLLAEYDAQAPSRLAHRPVEPCARAAVDLGYAPPLDARLDTFALRGAFPGVRFATTQEMLQRLCAEMPL